MQVNRIGVSPYTVSHNCRRDIAFKGTKTNLKSVAGAALGGVLAKSLATNAAAMSSPAILTGSTGSGLLTSMFSLPYVSIVVTTAIGVALGWLVGEMLDDSNHSGNKH